jgi:hypothetical protein
VNPSQGLGFIDIWGDYGSQREDLIPQHFKAWSVEQGGPRRRPENWVENYVRNGRLPQETCHDGSHLGRPEHADSNGRYIEILH